ncbi:unnamed protein product [Fraxinus pennsylvanica]|uniref:RING-type E3 ubiquitin transferase n=1 Tax=Fraxinus pennsylvanica TaxID=56036 RepID=A0AAD1Z0D0_9LAMI|nr:unnamed protein product [Fraxinus pennsylvanica]
MSPILIGFFGIMAGAINIAICQCIFVLRECLLRHRRTNIANQSQTMSNIGQEHASSATSLSNSTMQFIITSTHTRESGHDVCAVCLNEFEEGDGVRVLPKCTHTFHISCIDKWLDSHRNCPLCRADIMLPSDHLVITLPDSGGAPPEL